MMDPTGLQPTRTFEDATPLLTDSAALRARAEEQGYLFFRGLLNPGRLLELRRQILSLYRQADLLDEARDFMEGVSDPDKVDRYVDNENLPEGGEPFLDLYWQVQHLQAFHAMSHDPALLGLFRLLFDEEPFPHPRNIARIMIRHPLVSPTPPHQDFIHIQGTERTWTCWFPLSDVPRELGGLCVLEQSHKEGVLHVTGAKGAGSLESILCDLDLEWATTDYRLGDVLILHSYTVHRSLPNKQGDKIRLSCDFRYQPVSLEIEERSLHPHAHHTWEEIYRDWTDDELKYYWKKYDLKKSDWDEKLRWQKDKIC